MPSLNDVTTRASKGSLDPVYVLVGTERLLIERAVDAVRKAVDSMGAPGFNIEVFDGKGLDATRVISAARTLPMMADTRLVLLRHVDAMTPTEQTNLAEYLEDPSESTCFVLTATKLDGRAKLAKAAKKKGYLIDAKPLRGRELREFIRRRRRPASTASRRRRSKRYSMPWATTSPRSTTRWNGCRCSSAPVSASTPTP